MARTTSVTIGGDLDNFVHQLLESGRYGSTSEVMRSALRLLEQQESQQALLRTELTKGEESGESPYDLKEISARIKRAQNV